MADRYQCNWEPLFGLWDGSFARGPAFPVLVNPLYFLGFRLVLKLFSLFGNYLSTMGFQGFMFFSVALRNATHTHTRNHEYINLHHSCRLLYRNGRNLRMAQSSGDFPWNHGRMRRHLRCCCNPSRLKQLEIISCLLAICRHSLHIQA